MQFSGNFNKSFPFLRLHSNNKRVRLKVIIRKTNEILWKSDGPLAVKVQACYSLIHGDNDSVPAN